MQISDDNQSANDRMDISAGVEIRQDCDGQKYFEFIAEETTDITTTKENTDE